ncbi:MAG: glycosyltransferase family 9 protein [Rhodospirillales bacterium CG15_BIG_FIL_POST_REV_8_21_14_020_66_15]|nr:MAG: glycosyltransferase family 9 protein [Rhodospirillales bacterium CG15_BIG_FIL_POST_REV_8_21_14_020_66_15]
MAKSILFVTATRIGDAVLSMGILGRLVQENPGARVTVACGRAAAPLFEAVPGLERVIVLDKKPYSLHWLGLWMECAGRLWSILVDLRNTPMTYMIPARRCFRMGRKGAGHRLERYAQVMGITDAVPTPRVWITDAHRAAAGRLIPRGRPVLAIGPTANWKGKTWPQDRFTELVRRLTGDKGILPGAAVAVFGHETERASVERFLDGIPEDRRIDLVGRISLLEAMACLERTSLYIGNDSGLMHLAAAAGVPTLGLFGPTQDELYAPWGAHCRTVRGAGFLESFPENYDWDNSPTLMEKLSVDAAEAAARDLWTECKEAAS